MEHYIVNLSNKYQIQDIRRIFKELERAQTDRQTNRMHKYFSIFLDNVKKKHTGKLI